MSPLSAAMASRKPRSSHVLVILLSGQTHAGDVRLETKDAFPALVIFHEGKQSKHTSSPPFLSLFKVYRCMKRTFFGAGFVTTRLLFLAVLSGQSGPGHMLFLGTR